MVIQNNHRRWIDRLGGGFTVIPFFIWVCSHIWPHGFLSRLNIEITAVFVLFVPIWFVWKFISTARAERSEEEANRRVLLLERENSALDAK